MSKASNGLGDHAAELETLAETADEPAQADAYRVFAALANGETVPQDALRRARQRAEGDSQ